MFDKEAIFNYLRGYLLEIILIVIAICITGYTFFSARNANIQSPEVLSETALIDKRKIINPPSAKFSVEVSGAVLNPDVFEVTPGARLKDLIDIAGGLTPNADKGFVARNYNLARFVADQEKIYIPFVWDIRNGTFFEEKRILEYLQPLYQSSSKAPLLYKEGSSDVASEGGGLTISINTASIEELDTLPGVGPVTAQKIVDSRPYSSLDELLSRKVVNTTTLEKMREFIKL